MNSGIYAIKNIVNGKMYIGQSKDIKKRWSFHLWTLRTNRHFNPKLQNAFNKYGEKNFSFIALESCAENLLNNREVYYISLYDTVDSGYNITQGGDGSPGRKLSEQTKIKISKANSGRKNTKEEKIRKSQALKKLWKDPIFIMKMHNRPRPKISWNKGRKHTEKEKKNLSEKLKGRKISDEHKKKLHDLYKGEKSLSAKLKEKDIVNIRLRFLKGERQCIIVKDYPVTNQTIYDIVHNRRWQHVPNTIEELEKMVD